MALRRDDPYTDLAREYINRGKPVEPARSSTPAEPQTPSSAEVEETRALRRRRSTSETEKAFVSGVRGVESGLYATRGLIRSAAGGNGDADLQRAVDIQQTASTEGPRIRQVEDIKDIGDAAAYARNIAVEQLPNLALMVGSGGLAGAARAGAGRYARNRAITEAAERATLNRAARAGTDAAASGVRDTAARIARRLPEAPAAGQTAQRLGAAAAGTALQGGQMADAALDDTQTKDRQERALMAGAGAVLTGAFEALPVMSLMRRYGLAGAERQITGGVARRMATHAVAQGAQESATEVAQTFGELATHKWINDNVQLMDAEAVSQYVNAAIGGAVGGSIYGAPAGLRGGARNGEQTRSRLMEGLTKGLENVRAKMGQAGQPMEAANDAPTNTGDIREQFDAALKRTRDQAENSAVLADLDAEPWDFSVVDNEAVLGGAPLASFVNPRVVEALEGSGYGPIEARLASAIEDGATIGRLRSEGALDAASRVFRGDDIGSFTPAEKTGLENFLQALPEKKRMDFLRTSATWESLADRGLLERDESGRMVDNNLYDPESAGDLARGSQDGETQELASQQGTQDVASTDLREVTPEKLSRNVFRAARGPARSQGDAPNSFVMQREDGSGDRREVNLYSAIQALREQDPGFQQSINELPAERRTEAQVTAVLGYLAEQGYQVDPASIRPMNLSANGDWKLSPAEANRIRANLGDPGARAAVADTSTAVEPRQSLMDSRDVIDPRADIEELAGAGMVDGAPRGPVLPGQGSPSGSRVVNPDARRSTPGPYTPGEQTGARVEKVPYAPKTAPKEGDPERRARRAAREDTRTLDSGTVDTKVARAETATPTLRSGLERLDRMIQARTGGTPRTAAARRTAIAKVRSTLKGEALNTFNKEVADVARLNVPETEARLERAARQLRQTEAARRADRDAVPLSDLREARDAVTKAQARVEAAKKAADVERRRVTGTPSPQQSRPRPTAGRTAVAREVTPEQRRERQARELREKAAEADTQNSADATTVAKYLRGSFNQNANVREFRDSVGKLMSSPEGARRMVKALATNRSRYGLAELMDAVQDHRNKPGFDIVAGPLLARVDALSREVNEAGRAQVTREVLDFGYSTTFEQHNEVVDALNNVTDLQDGLRAVRSLATPSQQKLIDKLLDNSTKGVKLEIIGRIGQYTGGRHQGGTNTVTMFMAIDTFGSSFTNDAVGVLIHEAAHAATTRGEQRNPQVRKDLNALLNHVRSQHPDANEWYGLSDTQEFIAEAFGNPSFQRLLEQTPALNTKSFQNMWQEFMDVVRRVLGISDKADVTALDEVMALATQLQRDTAVARTSTLAGLMSGHGSAGVQNSPHANAPVNWVAMLPNDARARLLTAFESKYVVDQIKRILPPEQHQYIDAVDTGPELLLNLGVAMHMAGRLDLQSKDRGPVRALWDMMSKFLRIPNANVYATQILADIKSGYLQARGPRYDAQKRTIVKDKDDQIGKAMLTANRWVEKNAMPLFDTLLKNMNTRVRETGVPALRKLTTLVAQRTGEFRADKQRAYRQNWQDETNKRLNELAKVIAGITPEQERVLTRALQNNSLPKKHDGLQATYDGVRKYLDGMYAYMKEAGVDVGRRDNFFPVVMDAAKVEARRDVFFELHRAENFDQPIRDRFTKWTQALIDAIEPDDKGLFTKEQIEERNRLTDIIVDMPNRDIDELIGELYDMALYGGKEHYIAGVNFANEAHAPAFSSTKPRTSSFIFEFGTPEQIRTFTTMQATNLPSILVNYTKRATRRAEWERMGMTQQITSLLDEARDQGASPKEIRMAQDYLNMEMGTYNDNWNPVIKRMLAGVDRVFGSNLAQTDFQKWKAIQGALQTYNNVRLLPLAIVSSFVDPLATMVRSGGMAGAHRNLIDGFRALRNADGNDALRDMADKLGVIEREGLGDIMAHLYGGVYDPNSTAGKINQTLFKWNGLEGMMRYTRLTALAAGHRFLARHAAGNTDTSKRYLQELGLTAEEIQVRDDGYVVMTPKVQAALRRFVDESTVRPYAGQKPSWHNDPNFALAAQYKGYIYSFYETVLVRATNELQNGNLGVLVPVMAYIPITMVAEMARHMAQGRDDEEEDYLKKGIDRSGLLGPRIAITSDATTNVQYGSGILGNVAGPTGQQVGDAYDVLSGGGSFSNLATEALPGQALYKQWGD